MPRPVCAWAQHEQGQDIGRWDVLRAAAVEAGLDAEEMQRRVEAGAQRGTVDAQIGEAQRLGLTGVPTFIFDDRYAIVGAQPFSVFAGVMDRLGQAPRPMVPISSEAWRSSSVSQLCDQMLMAAERASYMPPRSTS